MRYFRHKVNGNKIHIYPLVCWHIGAKQSATKFIERIIKTIQDDPLARWIYMGDAGECVLKNSKGNVFEQLFSPGEQLRVASELLAPIRDKGIFGIRGNHGNRIDKETGVGWDEMLCARIGIPYLGVCAFGDIVMHMPGNSKRQTSLSLFAHHGSAGAITPGGKTTAGYKPTHYAQADIVLTAHSHAAGELFVRQWARTNPAQRRVDWLTQHVYVCGSAYDARSGYGEEKLYSPILPEHLRIDLEVIRRRGGGERRVEWLISHQPIRGFSSELISVDNKIKWGWKD